MRRGNQNDLAKAKQVARQKYVERQIDKWIRWSINNRGKLKWKELVEIHDKYNIKCHG
jgi:hypothetical protein